MEQYLSLLKDAYLNGVDKEDRTGVGTRFINGATAKWYLADGFPIVTTRRVALRIAFEETMFFLRGETDTTKLEKKNIDIWKGNTSREFLDKNGLQDLPVGNIGTGYSHCWRNFGGTVGLMDGVDQVRIMLINMKLNPTDRRHVITAWNPMQLSGTPLPPCHLMHMYTVDIQNNTLNSCFIMRSSDLYLGLPMNIMGYALLNCIFASYLGLNPGELTYFGWDAHIYTNQYDVIKEQIERRPVALPTLTINKKLTMFEDILSLEFSDLKLTGYNPLPALDKIEMAI